MATQLPVFWPGEFHGVYSLEGCKELDITEQLSGGLVVKSPSANAGDSGDTGLVPGSGRSPGEGNVNPLQYCLKTFMDRGA